MKKMKTLKIEKLGIEVDVEETQKGVAYKNIKIPKGKRLLKGWEAMYLYQNHQKELNLNWFWVDGVARFTAIANVAVLGCNWNPAYTYTGLGVRFCRELKNEN